MRKLKFLMVVAVMAVAFGYGASAWAAAPAAPATAAVADAPAAYLGRILIDAGRHGEAWYINPETKGRLYLGRPQEAIERFREVATRVDFHNIERVAEVAGAPDDEAYVAEVLGHVLAPNDTIGAVWYVDPTARLRRRLATSDDAWDVMRTGIPVASRVLDAIKTDTLPPVTEQVMCREVVDGDTLRLTDNREVRLLNVDVPANPDLQAAAVARLQHWCDLGNLLIERDVATVDTDGALLRHVFADDTYVNYDLVREGLAFQSIRNPNYKYGEMMIVGGLDAMHQKKGFWNH